MRALALGLTALALLGCEDSSETDRWSGKSVSADPAEPSPPQAPAPSEPTTAAPPEGSGAASVPGILFEALPSALGAVLCDKIFECCGPGEAMSLILGTQLTRDNCPFLAPYYFGDYFETRTLSVVEKRVAYFADQVPACLQKLSSRSCEEFGAALARGPSFPSNHPTFGPAAFTCDDLLAADQTPGQLCQNDYECIGGVCVNTVGGDRRCQAYIEEGRGCSGFAGACATGLACLGGVCRKPGAEGEPCFDVYSELSCQTGLFCGNARTCQPRLPDGALCDAFPSSSQACLSGSCQYEYDPSLGYYVGRCAPTVPPPPGPPSTCAGK
jgi:hypothetical protein